VQDHFYVNLWRSAGADRKWDLKSAFCVIECIYGAEKMFSF